MLELHIRAYNGLGTTVFMLNKPLEFTYGSPIMYSSATFTDEFFSFGTESTVPIRIDDAFVIDCPTMADAPLST